MNDLATASAVRASKVAGSDLALVLAGAIDAVEEARLRVAEHLAPLALPARAVNRIEVVLEELISNVVRHGFDAAPGHAMLLVVGPRPGAVRITLEDDGRPFDPVAAPEPPPLTDLATAQLGGLGIRTVRRFSQSFTYEAAPESALWAEFALGGGRPVNRVVVQIADA
jgi:serine/threonine-protein kinase RsbW